MKQLRHIACIDDEEDILEVVKLCLELDGFTVTAYGSGEDAVRMLPQSGADLVLLDVMMPRMDGPATLAVMKAAEQTKNFPVIFMTARVRGSEVAQYLEMGSVGVIPKPFDPGTLTSEIRRIWQTHEAGQAE